jgi:hypothetical protein
MKKVFKNIFVPIVIGFLFWIIVGHGSLTLLPFSMLGSILGWNIVAFINDTF